jgi:hypothetical protein
VEGDREAGGGRKRNKGEREVETRERESEVGRYGR